MAIEPQEISQEEYNKRVTAWGSALGNKIRTSIRSLTSKGKGDLLKSLRLKTAKWYGEVDLLSYHFVRHGVFVHKGVGRGYVMIGGNVVHVKGYISKKSIMDYAKRRGRTYATPFDASLKRKPDEWFNPVVKDNIEDLADLIAEMDADRAVNTTEILIK
jgi:hypothetical protein